MLNNSYTLNNKVYEEILIDYVTYEHKRQKIKELM